MSKLLSLVIVYLFYRTLKNYSIFQKLQLCCNATWLDDLMFKAQILANTINNKVPMIGSCAILLMAVTLIVLLLQLIFHTMGELGTLIFNVVLLLYCLYSANKKNYSSIFVTSFEHSFSLLFWFATLGPVGLILSWLFLLSGVKPDAASELYYAKNISNLLFKMHTIAVWLPARITGLIFSLVGDFEQGFNRWKAIIKVLNMPHTELLDTCGEASLGSLTMEHSQLLVDRAFIAWMIFCALITIISL